MLAAARRAAAASRVRRRDTEAERSRLADVVEGYQRRDAEQLDAQARTQRLALGADLWAGSVKLADVLDSAGTVDESKVHAAVAQVLAARPHWRAGAGNIARASATRRPVALPTRTCCAAA